jgi:hypothetical protein
MQNEIDPDPSLAALVVEDELSVEPSAITIGTRTVPGWNEPGENEIP